MLDEVGLAVAEPVVPPVDEAWVVDAPVLPEVALPTELALAAPLEPPLAVAVALPELPEVTMTPTPPLPPPPVTAPENARSEMAAPVSPLVGVAVAAPPGPLAAVLTGALVAAPELPVLPPLAVESPVASPLVASPVVVEVLVALPENPPSPVGPDPAEPPAMAAPEPPVGAALPPVEPDTAFDVWEALPEAPEAPPLPVLAVLDEIGLDTAEPVVPPVADDVVVEAPDGARGGIAGRGGGGRARASAGGVGRHRTRVAGGDDNADRAAAAAA